MGMLTASSANATSSSGWPPLAMRGRRDKAEKRSGGGGGERERDKTERDGTEASI
jgi:hypothetical protein